MVNHYVPSQWKEYCGKSKAWCDGFQKAVENANKKESDPKLDAVLKDIDGASSDSKHSPGAATRETNHDHKHINPNSAGIQSPLWTYIAAYFIIIAFSLFVVGVCCSKYFSSKKNSNNQGISNTKNSKNSKKNTSKSKKNLSSKAKKFSTKTSRRAKSLKSRAKSSKKSTAKSSKKSSKKHQNQSVSTKRMR